MENEEGGQFSVQEIIKISRSLGGGCSTPTACLFVPTVLDGFVPGLSKGVMKLSNFISFLMSCGIVKYVASWLFVTQIYCVNKKKHTIISKMWFP